MDYLHERISARAFDFYLFTLLEFAQLEIIVKQV
jgi:hypothetical protein